MRIYHQSVFEKWPLEDKSVQAIITSPPYWGLRKYEIPDIIIGGDRDCEHEWKIINHPAKGGKNKSDNMPPVGANRLEQEKEISIRWGYKSNYCTQCNTWKGQYGLEPDFKIYIAHTLLWAKEAWRVLKDDGIFFLNLGDSYNSHTSFAKTCGGIIKKQIEKKPEVLAKIPERHSQKMPDKCLLDIPARVSIALVDEQGWVKRNNIVWHKPNGMPESCKDRFSKKYEMIFFFTKNPQYFSNLGEVREPHKQSSIERLGRGVSENNKWVMGPDGQTPHGLSQPRMNKKKLMPPIGGLKNANELGGIYSGEQREWNLKGKNPGDVWDIPTQPSSEKHFAMWPEALVKRMILCSTRPGDIVLDPFCGSGTTLKVAEKLGREGIGIDLGYEDIQKRRLSGIQKELGIR